MKTTTTATPAQQPAPEADAPTYDVFVRDWWREARPEDGRWPNGLVPYAGAPREYLAREVSFTEARELCADYNDSHEEGRYSRKAEFERT